MVPPCHSGTIAAPAKSHDRIWRSEIIETVKLALPIALTQLGQIAMMTTDLALIGRLGDSAVAAVGLAHLILFFGFVLGMGLVSAVVPLAAQAFGARQPRMVRRALRVGLWAAVIFGVPVNVAQLWGEHLLIAAGQTPESSALAARYLTGLTWSMIPAWCFIALRNFMGAVNRPEPALWVTVAAIPVNALLAYALIHGAFGLPRLDLLGAGLATAIVSAGMCVAAIWICYACRPFKKHHVLGRSNGLGLMRNSSDRCYFRGMALEWGLFFGRAPRRLDRHTHSPPIRSHCSPRHLSWSAWHLARRDRARGHAVGRRDPAARRAGFGCHRLGAVFICGDDLESSSRA